MLAHIKSGWQSSPPWEMQSTVFFVFTVKLVFWCVFFLLLLQGAVSGSVQASDRLMKELREIYRSQSYKTGTHTPTKVWKKLKAHMQP